MARLKKFFGVLVTLELLLGFAITTLAADSFTVTVYGNEGESYAAYKILDAVESTGETETGSETTDAPYSISPDSAWFAAVSAAESPFDVTVSAQDSSLYFVTLKNDKDESDIAAYFSEIICPDAAVAASAGTIKTGKDSITLDLTDSGAGYYYVSTSPGSVFELTSAVSTATVEDSAVSAEESAGDTVLTYDGEDYSITVSFGEDARLPENVQLVVSEYAEDSETWQARYAQAALLYGWEESYDFRLFNITLCADGEEIEPAAQVNVTVTYSEMEEEAQYSITHYADGETKSLDSESSYDDGVQSISFCTDSFSDYGIATASTDDQGDIGSELDGDYAYLSDVALVADESTASGYSVRTGTSPWDSEEGAGNDTTGLDNVLRTYDITTYTVTFTSRVRDDAPYKTYYQGNLYFEFILQGDSTEVQYEEGSMSWLSAKNAVYTITEEEIDGVTCQVLRGYYLWTPASGNTHAIGESTQELTLAIRALAMKNGDTIQPTFTFFLYGNDVGVDYTDWGTADYAGGAVTDSEYACAEHGEVEFQTITSPLITVSAIANYNVKLVSDSYQTTGTFDFSTGNSLALDSDAGSVSGRLGSYAITIQIVGKSATEGLKGIELPKSGEDITFTITLASTAKYSSSTKDVTSEYTPLVWSFEGNSVSSTQQDGRAIPAVLQRYYASNSPLNKYSSSSTYSYRSCYDGGTWTAAQSGTTLSITISDWQLNMNYLPYGNASSSTTTYTYYDPTSIDNYWDIQYACIAGGELWVVQPFYNSDGEYILDYLGASDASFTVTAKDSSFSITDSSGNTITTQAVTTDDSVSQSFALVKPGSIQQQIQYQAYNRSGWNDPLTEGCWGTPKDWILSGNKLAIFNWLTNDGSEDQYTAVAYDQLVKFDDAFFDLESVSAATLNSSVLAVKPTILYAAKADKTGWSHTDEDGNELSPGDDGYDAEMIYATTDDLVYFSSLSVLESEGYTCVGVLVEYRGLMSESYNHTDVTLKGSAKTTAAVNCVYMITQYARAWNRNDLAEACAESGNSEYESYTLNDILGMSASEIKTLVNELIPSRSTTALDSGTSTDTLTYASDYPDCYWINGGADGTSSSSSLIRNYVKASYDENGYVAGATSGTYYGDSCLLVGYTSGVDLSVAQTTTDGTEKSSYDMDTNQRIVDYVLEGYIIRDSSESSTESQSQLTTVTFTATLPDGLTYLEGSSYIGGTYTSNGEGVQGTVTDGTQLSENGSVVYTTEDGVEITVTLTVTETVTEDSDGNTTTTTTLTYVLVGVEINGDATQYLDKIYFSAQIGTPGVESTDVVNNQSLTTSATVITTEDYTREFSTTNGNYSETSILVSKNSAVSLVKFADQSVVDVGSEMGFTMDVDNNSSNTLSIVAVDSLPYSGDGVSSFTGDVVVTEFSVTSNSTADLSNITFYYTLNTDYCGLDSEDLASEDFSDTDIWTVLTVDSSTGVADLPSNFQPVAIVAVGTLESEEMLEMHITIDLPDAEPGDYIVNNLSRGNLSSSARCRVVNRTLSGLTWLDSNGDGIQDSGEEAISGVSIMLLKLNDDNEYEAVCYSGTDTPVIIETGTQVDLLNATGEDDIEEYTAGYYFFTNLSAGTYALMFYSGTTDITGYVASPVDEGDDDAVDSDAVAAYSGYSLSYTIITDIDMPDASELTYSTYSSANNDSGFLLYELEIIKTDVTDSSGETVLQGVSFKLEKLTEDDSGELSVDSSVTYSEETTDENGIITYSDLSAGIYRLTETNTVDGYYMLTNSILLTLGTDLTATAVEDCTDPAAYSVSINENTVSVTVPNAPGSELPMFGGAGTFIYMLPGVLLCAGAAVLVYLKRRRRLNKPGVQ
ncbi:MAG: hypothetical protein LUH82_07130 [Clostridiales bacterium]|nr:hypothetical protein [Clostridiales bacterium]